LLLFYIFRGPLKKTVEVDCTIQRPKTIMMVKSPKVLQDLNMRVIARLRLIMHLNMRVIARLRLIMHYKQKL